MSTIKKPELKVNGMEILDVIIFENEVGLSKVNAYSRYKFTFLLSKIRKYGVVLDNKIYTKYISNLIASDFDTSIAASRSEMSRANYLRVLKKCQKYFQLYYVHNYYLNESSPEYRSKLYDKIFEVDKTISYANGFIPGTLDKIRNKAIHTEKVNAEKVEVKRWLNYLSSLSTTAEIILAVRDKTREEKENAKISMQEEGYHPIDIMSIIGLVNPGSRVTLATGSLYSNVIDEIAKGLKGSLDTNYIKALIDRLNSCIKATIVPDTEQDKMSFLEYAHKNFRKMNAIYGYDLYPIY